MRGGGQARKDASIQKRNGGVTERVVGHAPPRTHAAGSRSRSRWEHMGEEQLRFEMAPTTPRCSTLPGMLGADFTIVDAPDW